MKIWFDADNGPHVLIFRPLIREFERRGHEILVTARDRTNTCELLDLYGISYRTVGGTYGRGMFRKVLGTLGRAVALAAEMRGSGCRVSFGHGSRALPIASRLLGIPSLTMYDYEWVNARLFNLCCRTILLPESIDRERCCEAGIDTRRVVGFPGFKEELYLADTALDPQTVLKDLRLRSGAIKILLRPPATDAHYHNPESEKILRSIMIRISGRSDIDLVYLARNKDQISWLADHELGRVIVPKKVYDGPSLIAAMDLVIGGGGTMSREAAILGVPAYSFFRGKTGRVDEQLVKQGRLIMFAEPSDVSQLEPARREGTVFQPDNIALTTFICDQILETNGVHG